MKNLILIFALFIGLFTQAQTSEIVISQISHTDGTYTHIKGDDNLAVNCFTASSSITLAMSVNGLNVDNVYMDDVPFKWTGPNARAIAEGFIRWDGYNRIYRNREGAWPVYVENHELLSCAGWVLGSDGQTYTNTGLAGYSYNSFGIDPVVNHGNSLGAHVSFNGERIQFGGVAADRASLEASIEVAIRAHMNPATAPEAGTSTPTTAVDQWNQGGIQGLSLHSGRYDQTWSNPIYPGYAYTAQQNPYIPSEGWMVRVGVLNSGSWTNIDIPGRHDSEADADIAGRAYIASRFANLNYADGSGHRSSVFAYGDGLYYALVLNSDEEIVSWERYGSFAEARNAGLNYSPTAIAETPTSSTSGLCLGSDSSQNPIGFFENNYITSSVTENGVSRFDYITANTAYEYRDLNRTNPWNRFGIYPPVIVIASSQVKVISHRSSEEIQPSDVLATISMTDDCSILDAFIATAVASYRSAFDGRVSSIVLPAPTMDHTWSNDGSFTGEWTSPRFPGWQYSFQGLTSGIRLTVTNHTGRNFLLRTYTREAGESDEDFYGRMHVAARRVVIGQDDSFVNEWREGYFRGHNPAYYGYYYRVSGSNGNLTVTVYSGSDQYDLHRGGTVVVQETGVDFIWRAHERGRALIENAYLN